ncbi:MAG: hypothetical protein JRD68_00210 [Deltaproteobacteria bacterium]|nr:hypothetical protein [Deltaproteobacteria bacterium]
MSDLTPAKEFIWKWRNRQLSGFGLALLHLIQQADVHNLERLRPAFPEEVEGYMSYKLIPGWWDDLEARMRRVT